MSANSLKSGLKGPNNIRFKDGQHIRFRTPDWRLGGTVMGDRTIEAEGSVIFEDITNNLKTVIVFSTYTKSGFFTTTETGQKDEFIGLIYNCNPINPETSYKKLFAKSGADEFTNLT